MPLPPLPLAQLIAGLELPTPEEIGVDVNMLTLAVSDVISKRGWVGTVAAVRPIGVSGGTAPLLFLKTTKTALVDALNCRGQSALDPATLQGNLPQGVSNWREYRRRLRWNPDFTRTRRLVATCATQWLLREQCAEAGGRRQCGRL